MEAEHKQPLIEKAQREYETFMEVMNRPKRDLVMIAACELVNRSITDFLIALLTEKGISANTNENLLELQSKCASVDKSFEKLDLGLIAKFGPGSSVKFEDSIDDHHLAGFLATLQQVKNLVLELV